MAVDPILESYLNAIDDALSGVSSTEKIEIINEIKERVLKSYSDGQAMGSILTDIGPAEKVANAYRLTKGLPPLKKKTSSLFKWLTIGFLGSFALAVITIVILVWKFTPIISVDEENDSVSFFGGAINIDSDSSFDDEGVQWSFQSGNSQTSVVTEKKWDHQLAGEKSIAADKSVELLFANGKLAIERSVNDELHWQCQYSGAKEGVFTSDEDAKFVLNFDNSKGMKCLLLVPESIKVIVRGKNGKIKLTDSLGDRDISLKNGKVKVSISEENKQDYKFDLDVKNGIKGRFESSKNSNAINIKIAIVNGVVSGGRK